MSLYAVNFLWLLSTGMGLLLAAYGFREAFLDLKALLKYGKNGDKKVLAYGSLWSQAILFVGQGAFLGPGVGSLFAPMPTNPVSLVAGLLILGSWCMTAASGIQIYCNRRVVAGGDSGSSALRDATRDLGRDEGRDPIRDAARDTARDQEKGNAS